MSTLAALLSENGLPDLPVSLIEPHRDHGGLWRIKFQLRNKRATLHECDAGVSDGLASS